jgi:phosphoglycolate phosphatase
LIMKILLFDIDGTLVLTGGAGARAMLQAFEETFGVPSVPDGLSMAGRTDAWILSHLVRQRGLEAPDPATRERFRSVYLMHLAREVLQPGPRKGLLPGVRTLLDALSARHDAYLALLTGNFHHGARTKLEYFDLWRYFSCGAFGDDVHDRNALLPLALDRIAAIGGPVAARHDVIVVGDTPFDVQVARAGGVRSLAVATGSHTVEELAACGADVALPDLANLAAALEAIGFEG